MNTTHRWMAFVLLTAVLVSGCALPSWLVFGRAPMAEVGPLQTESRSVPLGDAGPVQVRIDQAVGDLQVSGGAEDLLDADFTYNVALLKPEVTYEDGTLTVRTPSASARSLQDLLDFRYEWKLRLNDGVPMDLKVIVGAASSDLDLSGLSLTGLDIDLGAGDSTIDLSGDWKQDLDATTQAGVGELTLRLPRDVGVRVEVNAGVGTVDAPDLSKEGDVYTNAAYGVSPVTLRIDLNAGVGEVNLELE